MEPAPLIGLLLALVGLDRGIAVKSGSWRGYEGLYRDPSNPTLLRNVVFTLIPAGVTLLIGIGAGLSTYFSVPAAIPLALLLLFFIGSLVCLGVAARPPKVLKPQWVVEEEDQSGHRALPLRGFDIALLILFGGLVVLGIGAVLIAVVNA
jgi:hypothetical protein